MCVHDGQIRFARKVAEFRKFPVEDSGNHGSDGIDQGRICIAFYHCVFLLLCISHLFLRRFVELSAHQNNPDIGKRFGNHQHTD